MPNIPMVMQKAIQEQQINTANVNLLLPTQTFGSILGAYEKLSIEIISIDTNPDNQDVYEIVKGSGKKTLGKIALQKIANALGIVWDPKNTTILESTPTKSRAKATGAIKKPNGEFIVISEEKTVDITVIEDEQMIKAEEDALKGKIIKWEKNPNGRSYPVFSEWKNEEEKRRYIELTVKKSLLSYRKFKDERAMTGAKSRVISALLAIKNTYTEEELRKPFAFPKITTNASAMLENPELREAALRRMTGSISSIFGNEQPIEKPALPYPSEVVVTEAEMADVLRSPTIEELKEKLSEYLDLGIFKDTNLKLIKSIIENTEVSENEVLDMIDRCESYLKKMEEKI